MSISVKLAPPTVRDFVPAPAALEAAPLGAAEVLELDDENAFDEPPQAARVRPASATAAPTPRRRRAGRMRDGAAVMVQVAFCVPCCRRRVRWALRRHRAAVTGRSRATCPATRCID